MCDWLRLRGMNCHGQSGCPDNKTLTCVLLFRHAWRGMVDVSVCVCNCSNKFSLGFHWQQKTGGFTMNSCVTYKEISRLCKLGAYTVNPDVKGRQTVIHSLMVQSDKLTFQNKKYDIMTLSTFTMLLNKVMSLITNQLIGHLIVIKLPFPKFPGTPKSITKLTLNKPPMMNLNSQKFRDSAGLSKSVAVHLITKWFFLP